MAEVSDGRRWFVARVQPGREQLAMIHLTRQGFEAYCPRVMVERIRRGRLVTESEPLFQNYLLIHMALDAASWRAINGTRGVSRLIGSSLDGPPSPVPIGEIERLQQRERAGELQVSEVLRIRQGDIVKVKNGPAVDRIGTVVRTRGERVTLLLGLLGHHLRVIAPQHALEIVARPQARTHLRAVR